MPANMQMNDAKRISCESEVTSPRTRSSVDDIHREARAADREVVEECRSLKTERCRGRRRSEVIQMHPASILQTELLSVITARKIAEFSYGNDAISLMLTCSNIAFAMHNRGQLVLPHFDYTPSMEGRLDLQSVSSMHIKAPQPENTFANHLPKCRKIFWQPKSLDAVAEGDFVESAPFSLQGINGLYFRFYPYGKKQSRPGYCSVYIGSDGSTTDVSLRICIGTTTRIVCQKLNSEFVDGFINFCDLPSSAGSRLEISVEVLHGPWDSQLAPMRLKSDLASAHWTIPRMNKTTLDIFKTGDRITSDVFSVSGLGEDACFVFYPKGDMVDDISSIGDFANVGLFGSSDRDVTFRLSSGSVSKVMTACSERYHSKLTGSTKSCGEFFDACFGHLEDVIEKDCLDLKLELIDTDASQCLFISENTAQWFFEDASHLFNTLRGEMLHSRYFTFGDQKSIFFCMQIAVRKNEFHINVTQINDKCPKTTGNLRIRLTAGTNQLMKTIPAEWNGLQDTVSTSFKAGPSPHEFNVEILLSDFQTTSC